MSRPAHEPVLPAGEPDAGDAPMLPELAARVPALLWECAANGGLIDCNAAWTQYRGRSRDEELGDGWFQGVHPGDLDRLRGEFAGATAAAQSIECELRLRRHDGGFRWMLLEGAPVAGEDGRIAGFIGSCTDVTRLKQEQIVLTERLALFDTLFTNAPIGFAFIDGEFRFVSVNPSMAELNRRTVTEHLGRTPAEVFGDATGAEVMAHLAHVRDEDEALNDVELATVAGDNDGPGAWLASFYPIHSPGGELLGIGVLIADVTARRRAEAELARYAGELRKANQVKDEVLGLVSHELRTPLTTLRGTANAIARHGKSLSEEQWAEALQDIESESERLQQIVENMLILARVEASDEFEVEPVRLNRIIERAVADHRVRHSSHRVEMHLNDLPPALGHGLYLRQVITNLLSNAVKYSDRDTVIEIEAKRDGDMAMVRVLDRGAGISAADVDRIFDPFFRAPGTAQRASGMGLGLAVCKRLIEEQNGTIAMVPRQGGGTQVMFTVPLIVDLPEE